MRELEFLPDWYPRLLRSRRFLRVQVWGTLLVAASVGLGLVSLRQDRARAEQTLTALSTQLAQTGSQLREVDRLTALQKQLRQREEVRDRLGMHVEAARILKTLEGVMPSNTALLDVNVEAAETAAPVAGLARANPKAAPVAVDRKLRVRVIGVAPTDVDFANFLTELQKVAFFEQVTWTGSRERKEAGYVMREFEVTFWLNLNHAPQ